MSRSTRHKEKHGSRSELYEDNSHEGTSARTRPFSFDEIMIRRKNRKPSGVVEVLVSEKGNRPERDISGNVSDHIESEGGYRNKNGSMSAVTNHSLDDIVKVSSRRTKNELSLTEDKVVKSKEKESCHYETKPKVTLDKDALDKAKGGKGDRQGHGRRKTEEVFSGDYENESGKRRARDLEGKERYADVSRGRSGKAYKTKHRDEDDERSKLKNQDDDRSRLKSQDDERSRLKSQVVERSRLKNQVDEGSRVKRQDNEKSRLKSQVDEGSRIKRQDDARSRINYQSNERSRLKNKADEGSRAKNLDGDRSRANNQDDDRSRTKNHDSGRWHGSSISERRDKESSQLQYEGSKLRKRRSRSRERGKDRGKRSVSLSPRSFKYHEQEHEQLLKYSSKDKSRKLLSDDDRRRISSNGSGSQFCKHDELTDKLGGYSPRKRKTEVSGTSPSPAHQSPEKTSAVLDDQPTGIKNNASSSVLGLHSIKTTMSPNTFEPSSTASDSSSTVRAFSAVFSNTSVDSIQLTQSTRPMRRLYVENIPASASEKAVMDCLNNFLLSSYVNRNHGTQPCISCIIQKEKGQALAEFLTPEDASAALSLDGISFLGSIIKVRRPKDYVEVATTGVADVSEAAPDSVSDVVRDTPHKIFIGGISSAISSEMLREITSAFGPLKAFHFAVATGLNESCAFLEYADHSITPKVCASLNGIRLGGKMLTVLPATPDAPSVNHTEVPPFCGTPEHAKPLLEKPTQVLMLKHLLDPEGPALTELELKEILEDVQLECARFGYVKSVNVVKSVECHTVPEKFEALDTKTVLSTDLENTTNGEGSRKTEASGEIVECSLPETSVLNPPNDSEVDEVKKGDIVCGEPRADHMEDDKCVACTVDYEEICEDTNSENNDHAISLELEDRLNSKDHVQDGGGNNDHVVSVEFDDEHVQDGDNSEHAISVGLEEDQLNSKDIVDDDKIVIKDGETKNQPIMMEDKVEAAAAAGDGRWMREISSTEVNDDGDDVKTNMDAAAAAVVRSENIDDPYYNGDDAASFELGCVLVEYTRTEAASAAAHCLHGRLFANRTVAVQYVPYDAYKAKFPERIG